MNFRIVLGSAVLLTLGGALSAQAVRDQIERFRADQAALERFYDLGFSEARAERLDAFYRERRTELEKVEFDGLDRDAKIDWLLFANHLEKKIEELGFAKARRAAQRPFLPFADDVLAFELDRRALKEAAAEACATRLATIVEAIKAKKRTVETDAKTYSGPGDKGILGEPQRLAAFHAARECEKLRGHLEHWFSQYRNFDPQTTWWCAKPLEDAVAALNDYAAHLKAKIAGLDDPDVLVGEPIGAAAIESGIRREMLPWSAKELVDLADEHFKWCEVEMKRASAEMGFGEDWKKALDEVKKRSVAPGEQPKLVVEQAREAIAFIDAKELMTIPSLCRELWRWEMNSPETQRVLPFASYDDLWMSVSYPTSDMDHERKLGALRGNNRHFTRLVTPHELVPGHHLQGWYADRERTWRKPFSTPFLVEGWAVYTEMLFWDHGFPKGPEDRIGALLWRMHRCARVVVSLGYHMGTMRPPEMVDHLVQRVGLEKDGATAEVRRYLSGGYGPLYQCGYLIGALQLRELRKECVASQAMSERSFHDAILKQNSIPIAMIRAALVPSVPLSKR